LYPGLVLDKIKMCNPDMPDAARRCEMQSHVMPRELERAGKGRYRVKGTELSIVQDGKQWKVEGHSDDLGGFASRGAALGKLRELGAVPEVQPEPTQQPVQPEAEKQPVVDPTDASGAEGANGATGERKRRPTTRKPRAKADAKV
jgi:hypothetical protein